MRERFAPFASAAAHLAGTHWAFAIAVMVILGWAVTGPMFAFSDTWQLVINTATTITTFLMVFLIQNTQNRDAAAIHLKLDELIRAVHRANDQLIDVENSTEDQIEELQREFRQQGINARRTLKPGPHSMNERGKGNGQATTRNSKE